MLRRAPLLVLLVTLGVSGCGRDRRAAEATAAAAERSLADGDLEGARAAAQEAVEAFPDSARVREVAGRVALARLDPAAAVEHLRRAVNLEDHPRRRGLLGRALAGVGRMDDAADELENALAQKADAPEVLRDAVYVYGRTGRLREALDLAARLLAVDPAAPATLVRVAGAYLRGGRRDEGAVLIRTLDPELISSVEDLILLGQVQYELGDGPRAVAALARAVSLAPDTPALHYNLGTARILAEDFRQAKKDFERSLELAPGDAKARGQLAYCLARTGRRESALLELDAALRQAPDDPVLKMLATELRGPGP